jgi:hypothetical protein
VFQQAVCYNLRLVVIKEFIHNFFFFFFKKREREMVITVVVGSMTVEALGHLPRDSKEAKLIQAHTEEREMVADACSTS